jgi:hypothetical protein
MLIEIEKGKETSKAGASKKTSSHKCKYIYCETIEKLRLSPLLHVVGRAREVVFAVPGDGLATTGLLPLQLVGDAIAKGVGFGTV